MMTPKDPPSENGAGRALFDHDFEEHDSRVDAVMLAERHRAELGKATAEVEHRTAVTEHSTARARYATAVVWLIFPIVLLLTLLVQRFGGE